jgi:hypothetical protein
VADLLNALGWALWAGVVVVVFLEITPKAKRRQVRQALDAHLYRRWRPTRYARGPFPS